MTLLFQQSHQGVGRFAKLGVVHVAAQREDLHFAFNDLLDLEFSHLSTRRHGDSRLSIDSATKDVRLANVVDSSDLCGSRESEAGD